eukprot:SAG22_NODE_2043_length_3090_cov_2.470077_2_plen_137_part_00
MTLPELRARYTELTGGDVPKRMNKDTEWIKAKIHALEVQSPTQEKFAKLRKESQPWIDTTEPIIAKWARLEAQLPKLSHDVGTETQRLTSARKTMVDLGVARDEAYEAFEKVAGTNMYCQMLQNYIVTNGMDKNGD